MRAVLFVARRRLGRHFIALTAAGLLLGIGFGLCFASLATARRTASAYDRILVASDAPDAAIQLGGSPEESEATLRAVPGIRHQRVYAGFVGRAAGVDPAQTRALLAPIDDEFPLELPVLRAGRLPDHDQVDEVFVNSSAADAAGLEVGDEVHFTFSHRNRPERGAATVRIVGIGDLPVEALTDDTTVLSVFVFTRAFYEAHRDLTMYAVSNIDLTPGLDPRRDVAAVVGALGHEVQSARNQEQRQVNEALRPTVVVLVALGLLALGAAMVAAAQVIQRDRDRWRNQSKTLIEVGMVPRQVRLVQLTTATVLAVSTMAFAFVTMLAASPLAPLGPLHDLDPGQGFGIDGTVAVFGMLAIATLIFGLTFVLSAVPRTASPTVPVRVSWVNAISRPAALAGLTLALQHRRRMWRTVGGTAIASAVLALSATFVVSAVTLSATPVRYGFDADLLAVNEFGNQAEADLAAAFGDTHDVVAATGFTTGTLLLDGEAVPGIAATTVKGELNPTLLQGRALRSDDEVVVGHDTLTELGADVGDVVPTQLSVDTQREPVNLRIVGVATFPSVHQSGIDGARLGVGALVTRAAYVRMGGDPDNDPEFTAIRLRDDAEPTELIPRNDDGFQDSIGTSTSWFTDAKPAELHQLDVAMPYFIRALVVAFIIVLAVVVHALWTLVRANARDHSILRAIGYTYRQLDEVTSWQAVPYIVALLVGVPVGVFLGRVAFNRFAASLAVVDDATSPPWLVAGLVGAVLFAVVVALGVSLTVARRARTAVILREA